MAPVAIEVKKKCVEMSQSGMTAREVFTQYYSKYYDTSFDGFRSMLKKWKRKVKADEKILEVGNLEYKFMPYATTVQVNKDGQITQSWIKSKANDSLLLELIETVKNNTPYEKIEIVYKEEAKGMLEIPLFDMHLGVSDLEYYMPTLQEILLLMDKQTYEEINIIIGQDMIHNDNFKGTTTKGTLIEKINVVKAWNDAKTFWYNIIDKAIEKANKVQIIYSQGNHDRVVTWSFMQMLKERYGDIVDDSLNQRKCITYGTNFIGFTHGEFKKNKPMDLRSQFSVKFPMEFARSKVIEIHCGHLHHETEKDEYGVMCRRLCTSNKEDEWSDEEGYIGANKRFMVFEWSLDKLKSIHYV